jgi:Fe-S cluster assembly protein SufD
LKNITTQQACNFDDSSVALNTAMAQTGFFMYIPYNTIVEKPIQIINLLRGANNLMVNQRSLIVVGKNSQVQVVICDHTLSNKLFLTNQVTEIFVDENSTFDYYNLQNQHEHSSQLASTFVETNG